MIFDLNSVPFDEAGRKYDLCIAGAGVAGIALANDLAARGPRVLLLEAGGFDFTDVSQNIYEGRNIGRPYYELAESRLRYLGGSSNHWGGWCRPLDAWDFETHEHVPHSGWPIAKAELDRYLDDASRILEISPQYSDRPVADAANVFSRIEFKTDTAVRFGEKYRRDLENSTQIDLLLNANLVDIRLTETNERAVAFLCSSYAEPKRRRTFSAENFVLAMGGIENARMLLNFQNQMATGIGNARDLVGRFFMEHFHAQGGYYVTEWEDWPFGKEEIHLAPTSEFMAKRQIANAGLRVGPITGPGPGLWSRARHQIVCAEDVVRDFVRTFYNLWCPPIDFVGGNVQVASEQVPNPDSRVMLSDDLDQFGLRRVSLDWRISDIDRYTIKTMVMTFAEYLAARNLGNVKVSDWILDDAQPVPGVGEDEWFGAGAHHMGTTRMARTPDEGVVDENCRVFGVENLFVAGSSVFPTGGHANPTLPLLQLALRLGAHLEQRLKG